MTNIFKRTVAGITAVTLSATTLLLTKPLMADPAESTDVTISKTYSPKDADEDVKMSTYSLHPEYYYGSPTHNVIPDLSPYTHAPDDYRIPWYSTFEGSEMPLEYAYYALDTGFSDGTQSDIAYCMDFMGPSPVEHVGGDITPTILDEIGHLSKYSADEIDNDPSLIKSSTLMMTPILFGFSPDLTAEQNAQRSEFDLTSAESVWVSSMAIKILSGSIVTTAGEENGLNLSSLYHDEFETELEGIFGTSKNNILANIAASLQGSPNSGLSTAYDSTSNTAHSAEVFTEIYNMLYLANELKIDNGNFERSLVLTKPTTTEVSDISGPYKINIAQGTLYSTAELSNEDHSLTSEKLNDDILIGISNEDSSKIRLVKKNGDEFPSETNGDKTYTIPVNTEFYVKLLDDVITSGNEEFSFSAAPKTICNVSSTFYRGTRTDGKKTQRMLPYIPISLSGEFSIPLNRAEELGAFRILKQDGTTQTPMANVDFLVFDQNTNLDENSAIATITTNADGIASLNDLQYGTYYVKEKTAPPNYILDTTLYAIEVNKVNTENQQYIHQTISNMPYGSLIINKQDPDGQSLSSAVFKLTSTSDIDYKGATIPAGAAIDGEKTTNDNGIASWDLLPYGTYTLSELTAPDGYFVTTKDYSVVIDGNNTLNVTKDIVNFPLGSIEINKTNISNHSPLKGAQFEIETTEEIEYNGQIYPPNTAIKTITTDENGTAYIDNLPYAKYIVREINAPDGFIKDSTPKEITINNTNVNPTIDFENTPYGKIIIRKVDAGDTSLLLAGAQFDIITMQNTTYDGIDFNQQEIIAHLTTDENGIAKIEKLIPGQYQIVEKTAPQGYQLLNAPRTVTVSANSETQLTQNVEIGNVKLGSLSLEKRDANNGALVGGAIFEISTVDGTTYNGQTYPAGSVIDTITLTTGVASVTGLEPGKYTVKEKTPPAGYTINSDSKEVTIIANQTPDPVIIENYPETGKIEIIKKDKYNDSLLEGAKFDVIIENNAYYNGTEYFPGDIIGRLVTNSQGYASLDNLPYGNYTIKETQSPEGYEIIDKNYSAVLSSNNKIDTKTIYNYLTRDLKIIKLEDGTNTTLSGAKFELRAAEDIQDIKTDRILYYRNDLVEEFETNDDGTYSISNLPRGRYIVIEVQAPDNYALNENNQYPVDLSTATTELVTIKVYNKRNVNHFSLTKKDGSTFQDSNVKKATFDIYVDEPNGIYFPNAVYSAMKDEVIEKDGVIGSFTVEFGIPYVSPDLPVGKYYLKEKETAQGYLLPGEGNSKIPIDLTKDSNELKLDIKNYRKDEYGLFKIEKYDSITKKPLAGAEFTVFDENNNAVGTVIIENDGVGYSSELPFGKYIIKETKAPDGYIKSDKEYEVNVLPDQEQAIVLQVENTPYVGELTIKKSDEYTNDVLPNAVFGIYNENRELVAKVTTDNAGQAIVSNLSIGKYFVKELSAPDGYLLDETSHEVEIKASGTSPVVKIGLEIKNRPITGVIKVIKQELNNTERKLPGAVFGIYSKQDESTLIEKIVTDNNGQAQTSELPLGSYIVKELAAPDGYKIIQESFSVVLGQKDQTSPIVYESLVVENAPVYSKGQIKLLKYDSEYPDNKLVGAKFEIRADEDIFESEKIYSAGQVVDTLVTNNNGEALSKILPSGNYSIVEISAPDGYVIDKRPISVSIKNNTSEDVQVEFIKVPNSKAEHPRGQFEIVKIDSKNRKPIANVSFEVFAKEDIAENGIVLYTKNQHIENLTTNKDGKVLSSLLPYGQYYIKETSLVDGYVENNSTYNVEIKSPYTSTVEKVTISNTPTKVIITKTDITNDKPVSGATIEIRDEYGELVVKEETDSNGEIEAFYLPVGKYYFKETVAPDGYILNESKFSFEILPSGKVTGTTEITNAPTEVIITKSDLTTGQPLPGATIEIKDASGKIVFKEVSGPNGEVKAFKLPVGKYTFTETAAPDGYVRAPESFEFEIYPDGKIRGDCTITNRPTEVVITKKDLTSGLPLPGATIEIKNATGAVVFHDVSDSNGEIKAFKLPVGKYTFTETAAPDGYIRTPETFEFEILPDGSVTGDCTITNRPTEVVITKKDITNAQPLPGAIIQIVDSNGNLAFEGKTDTNGVVRAFKLSSGKYTFREISAPDGYMINEESFSFTLHEDGTVEGDHEIFDKPIPPVKTGVETGGSTNWPVIPLSIALASIGVIIIFKIKKNHRK